MIIGVVTLGLITYTVVIWLWGCLTTLLIYQLTGVSPIKMSAESEKDLGFDYDRGFAVSAVPSRSGQTAKLRSTSPIATAPSPAQIRPHVSASMMQRKA